MAFGLSRPVKAVNVILNSLNFCIRWHGSVVLCYMPPTCRDDQSYLGMVASLVPDELT